MRGRALFITPVVPSASGNGLAMRAGLWLDALAKRYKTEVIVLPRFRSHESSPAFTRERADRWQVLSSPRHSDPGLPDMTIDVIGSDQDRLVHAAEEADFAVVFRTYLAPAARLIHDQGTPVILDADDLDWVRESRLGNHAEAAKWKKLVASLPTAADLVTCANAADLTVLQATSGGLPVRHVPNAIREPFDLETTVPTTPTYDLLIVGSMGYEPNADGVRWFVREVVPKLPGVHVAIVGASVPQDIKELANSSITVASDVPDVKAWYEKSRVAAVPVLAGSGTRTKIPEAWAHHRPVVSTSLGAEGINVGSGALIADTAETFALQCTRLLSDQTLCDETAKAGRDSYLREHTLENAIASVDAAIDALLNSKS